MKNLILLLQLFFLTSCNSQDIKKNESVRLKDDYTQKWEGNTLHIYFKGDKPYIGTNAVDIEPKENDDSREFYDWYRDYHFNRYFGPRYNYWKQTNKMDSTHVYIFHIKGKYAYFDYMFKWEKGNFSIYNVPVMWKK